LETLPPHHDEVLQANSGQRSDLCLFSLADWIWTWHFANDNKEKFVLYMVIGLCIGTIAILVAILFHFALRQQYPPRVGARRSKHSRHTADMDATIGLQSTNVGSSCGSPTWRDGGPGIPESESSTGDDRTLHDVDDVEMNNFNHHVDSLPRRGVGGNGVPSSTMPKCQHHHQLQQQQAGGGGMCSATLCSTRPGSSLGAAPTTTATINRSYATVTATGRCHTPGVAPTNNGALTMGHVPNGYGGASVGGAARYSAMQPTVGSSAQVASSSMMNRGPMIGSLGRSYAAANHQYGPNMDIGYNQFDGGPDTGSRTLQPMQHYYG
jgi:hypothetical protein